MQDILKREDRLISNKVKALLKEAPMSKAKLQCSCCLDTCPDFDQMERAKDFITMVRNSKAKSNKPVEKKKKFMILTEMNVTVKGISENPTRTELAAELARLESEVEFWRKWGEKSVDWLSKSIRQTAANIQFQKKLLSRHYLPNTQGKSTQTDYSLQGIEKAMRRSVKELYDPIMEQEWSSISVMDSGCQVSPLVQDKAIQLIDQWNQQQCQTQFIQSTSSKPTDFQQIQQQIIIFANPDLYSQTLQDYTDQCCQTLTPHSFTQHSPTLTQQSTQHPTPYHKLQQAYRRTLQLESLQSIGIGSQTDWPNTTYLLESACQVHLDLQTASNATASFNHQSDKKDLEAQTCSTFAGIYSPQFEVTLQHLSSFHNEINLLEPQTVQEILERHSHLFHRYSGTKSVDDLDTDLANLSKSLCMQPFRCFESSIERQSFSQEVNNKGVEQGKKGEGALLQMLVMQADAIDYFFKKK